MSESVSERPTFAQAFASDGGAASLPAPTSPETAAPAPASADAIVPPDATVAATDHPNTDDGPIPLERHKKILDGVYTERDTLKQQLDGWKAYEWAKQVKKEDYDAVTSWYAKAHANPVEFALGLVDELSSDQQHSAALRSHAARLLRAARQASPEAEAEIEPGIPAYDDKGQLVARTYTDGQIKQLLEREIEKRLGPLKQDLDTRQQREQREKSEHEQQQFVTRESQRIRGTVEKLPKAKEHWAAIVEKAKSYDADLPVGEALRDAYLEVVLPTLSQAAKSDVLDDLKTKAAASSMNPSGAAATGTKRPASFHDPSLQW